MSVERLEIFVEEPSMEAVLRALLPPLLGKIDFEVFSYQGKDDLLDKLPARLRGYSRFLPNSWRVLVLIDKDQNDCLKLKRRLEQAAIDAGLVTRSTSKTGKYAVVNRIVVKELEAWYFGDWEAVRKAYPKIDPSWPGRAGYRDPDDIIGGTWEAFERVAQQAGYFKGGLRKIEAAGRIAPLLSPQNNRSHSFQVFRRVIDELVAET